MQTIDRTGRLYSRRAAQAGGMRFLLRLVHGLITAFFLSCIGVIYAAGISNHPTLWSTLAVVALAIEGLVVLLNHGDCPLGCLHHKYGDDTPFFELLLPPRLAKQAVPFFGLVTLLGVLLLIF